MKVERIVTFPPFYENCYVIWDESSRDTYVIDPGGEAGRVVELIQKEGMKAKAVLATHSHPDHIMDAHGLCEALHIPFYWGKGEEVTWDAIPKSMSRIGLPMPPLPVVSKSLSSSDRLPFGRSFIEVIETPGHTSGGVCYYISDYKTIFTGDTLFQGSIGRSDLPGGNHEQLIEMIQSRLMVLPEETLVYSGHGELTTIGIEKESNPFLS